MGVKRYNITPMGKPRMTQRDKWKQRPCVMRYRAFKDQVRALGVEVPDSGATVIFYVPMPKSWTKTKRSFLDGKSHQQRPDIDNMLKALLDAVYEEDCQIWDIRVKKIWAQEGAISVIT